MKCYREGGCGPYEERSCSECPASKPEYLKRDIDIAIEDNKVSQDKYIELINNYMKLARHDAMQVFPNASTVEVTINSNGVSIRVYYPNKTVVSHHLSKEDMDEE